MMKRLGALWQYFIHPKRYNVLDLRLMDWKSKGKRKRVKSSMLKVEREYKARDQRLEVRGKYEKWRFLPLVEIMAKQLEVRCRETDIICIFMKKNPVFLISVFILRWEFRVFSIYLDFVKVEILERHPKFWLLIEVYILEKLQNITPYSSNHNIA